MPRVLIPVAWGLALVVVGFALLFVLRRILLRIGRRNPVATAMSHRARRPAHLLVALLGAHVVVAGFPDAGWHGGVQHALQLLEIGAVAWLVAALAVVIEDMALVRYRTDVRDNRLARRVHTQINLIRRVTVALIAVVAIGAMLMTFQAARVAGTSVLASAGVLGVIAGFAAQTLLSNVIAGIQLAFSDKLRLDDVVVVEKEWGHIEQITMTYVVVRIWDDRRLVFPTSYFVSTPFENWTRTEAAVQGTIELDLDWSVSVEDVRTELGRVLSDTDLWDGRTSVLQITEAVGGLVRIRALVSAADAPSLWDLRCLIRERLVAFIRQHHPEALPRTRLEPVALDALTSSENGRTAGRSSSSPSPPGGTAP